ncbi:hypothetical protein MVG78_02030 [Roseomonas gilardii subsp. gilardii]|uniref:hypothetical protein n=1 Tax=Roseomonas gilardii TaxID=257708 RepID=UPI001FF8C2FE|nr:hypothetical protein [Roseomonas gilardii]UPG72989.1 hypothetical protein MVG78_02030 [Roseomonas gilardii subsp. gilardii]
MDRHQRGPHLCRVRLLGPKLRPDVEQQEFDIGTCRIWDGMQPAGDVIDRCQDPEGFESPLRRLSSLCAEFRLVRSLPRSRILLEHIHP